MDFALSPELLELQQRTRSFIRDKIIPLEGDPRQTPHGPTEAFRRELVALAAAEGLVAPHVGVEYGGLGLSHVAKAVVFEESGYSLLGPVAMHHQVALSGVAVHHPGARRHDVALLSPYPDSVVQVDPEPGA